MYMYVTTLTFLMLRACVSLSMLWYCKMRTSSSTGGLGLDIKAGSFRREGFATLAPVTGQQEDHW